MEHNLKKVSEIVLNIIFICILLWFTYKVYLETGFYTAVLSVYFNIKMWYAKEVVKTAATIFRKAKNIKQI
jgi:cell division protein FtsB